jgi:hypothetical protein
LHTFYIIIIEKILACMYLSKDIKEGIFKKHGKSKKKHRGN